MRCHQPRRSPIAWLHARERNGLKREYNAPVPVDNASRTALERTRREDDPDRSVERQNTRLNIN